MVLSTRIKLALGLWFVAEAVVFVLIAKLIGFPEAILAGILTSLFGWTLLKRAGTSAMIKLRALLDGRVAERESPRFLDDGLATLGALALLMPGFLSDAIGLALAVPAARDRLAIWIGASGRIASFRAGAGMRAGPTTIDLDPQDWERQDRERAGPRQPVSKPTRG